MVSLKAGKALLDGGATNALRTTQDMGEWGQAVEVRVELAQGSAMLGQVLWSKTLLSLTPVQSIVLLLCLLGGHCGRAD